MARKIDRLYARGAGRWYADLRDLGGSREALIPSGETRATKDRDVAIALLASRVKQLETEQRTRHLEGLTRTVSLGKYCEEWLEGRYKSDTRGSTLARYDLAFSQVFQVLDPGTRMDQVSIATVRKALRDLRTLPSRKGGTLGSASARQVIAGMRQVYESAAIDGVVPDGFNPWARIPKGERPRPAPTSTEFLEVPEVLALMRELNKARTRHVPVSTIAWTLLLTGGRLNEVLGLESSDVDFARRVVHIRSNQWRPLKRGVERIVPLWPQLEVILRQHLAQSSRIGRGLLFPGTSLDGGERRLWGKLYRPISHAASQAHLHKKVTPQVFRVTYCASRLQTMDRGEPVALFTVKKEMGHFSLAMIERVYGRVGTVRHRADVVEYVEPGCGIVASVAL